MGDAWPSILGLFGDADDDDSSGVGQQQVRSIKGVL